MEKTSPSCLCEVASEQEKMSLSTRNGAWQAQNRTAIVSLMIFWLCTAFQMHWFTSFRIPNIAVCISIACSNGYIFMAVQKQVCSGAHKRLLKAIRQDSCLSYAHLSALHIPVALLVTPQKQAIPSSSPQTHLSFRLIQGLGKPKSLVLKCYNQDGTSELYSWALLL